MAHGYFTFICTRKDFFINKFVIFHETKYKSDTQREEGLCHNYSQAYKKLFVNCCTSENYLGTFRPLNYEIKEGGRWNGFLRYVFSNPSKTVERKVSTFLGGVFRVADSTYTWASINETNGY